jgi:hypothetical protein
MGVFGNSLRALGGQQLPDTLLVRGRRFERERAIKHSFATAVGVYRRGEERVVCKFHRRASFLGLPLGWLGRLLARYEAAVLKQVHDVPGVPRLRGVPQPGVVARDFVPGRPLHRDMDVRDDFFPRLLDLLGTIHRRGIAYVDLEKPGNILLGDDGHPYLIDFQVAFHVPPKCLGQTTGVRWLRVLCQRGDRYHAMKHFRRMRPDLLTPQEWAMGKVRPWPVRAGNAIAAPLKKLRRWMLR